MDLEKFKSVFKFSMRIMHLFRSGNFANPLTVDKKEFAIASVIKKMNSKSTPTHPLSRTFDTAEEGAQAKADYVVKTVLKDFNWDAFIAKKQPAKKPN